MQGDMTWVREDLGVVHEVMEKIAEHVSGFEKNTNEEDGPREDVDLGGSPWGSWRDAIKEPEHAKARATGMDKVKRASLCDV